MSMLSNATGADAGTKGGAAGADAGKPQGAEGGQGGDTSGKGGAGGETAGKGAGDAGAGAGKGGDALNFTAEGFAESLKNPDVYKDGKIFGKYTSIEEAAKGHKELVGQMVNRGKAPDEYDVSKAVVDGKPDIKLDKDSAMAKALLPVMKKHNVSQEAFNEMASAFLGAQAEDFINSDEEFKSLGAEGQTMVDNVATHVLAKAPAELKQDIEEVTTTAAGIRVLNFMLNGRVEGRIPHEASPNTRKSSKEWAQEAADYDQKHTKTIGIDKSQQDHYNYLREQQVKAEMAEKAGK